MVIITPAWKKRHLLEEHLFQHFTEFLMGITYFLIQILGTAMLDDCGETISTEIPFMIHIGNGTHAGTQNDFHVIGEVQLGGRKMY